MEGPTPVSALLHAATMVTAGIFLIIRLSLFFEQLPRLLIIMSLIGALTAFFAGTCGATQNDIKKIIAYSTCSQLGFMLVCCGFSYYTLSLFHLFTHAFFKACLFLSAGSVIHSLSGEQDIRRMGGLYNIMPVTFMTMLIASLSLMGMPFLSGFYSKDVILEQIYISQYGQISFILCLIATTLTAFYSTRLLYYVFLSTPKMSRLILNRSHESNGAMLIALILLALASIFAGFNMKAIFIGASNTEFSIFSWLFITPMSVKPI